jgi:hypothetical protein
LKWRNRFLSEAELLSLDENPWQIFKSQRTVTYFGAAAAGGTTDVPVSDNPTGGITDAVSALAASVSVADTPSTGVTDAIAALAAALSAAESPTAGLTDAVSSLVAALAVVDSPTIAVTDLAGALQAALDRADAPTAAIIDAVSEVIAALSAADVPTISIADASSLVQTAVSEFAPSSDVAAGGWTASAGGALYPMVDELAADDADYIQSTVNPSADVAELKFAASGAPSVTHSHRLRYRIKSTLGTESLIVSLYCGATLIKSETRSPVPATWTTYEMALSGAEAASITDYADLRVRLSASA